MPLFRDNTPAPLFLFRVRTTQQSQTRLRLLAEFWTCHWAMQNWCFVTNLQVHFSMPDGSLERKTSSENRNAINMET